MAPIDDSQTPQNTTKQPQGSRALEQGAMGRLGRGFAGADWRSLDVDDDRLSKGVLMQVAGMDDFI